MTPQRLEPQPWMESEETRSVLAALTAGGAEARFVGGCVRDALLDRKVKDIDIATPLEPEAVMERLKAAGLGVVPTGLAHGTVTAIAHHRRPKGQVFGRALRKANHARPQR